METNCLRWHQMGPTNPDLADMLGRMDFDNFDFLDFLITDFWNLPWQCWQLAVALKPADGLAAAINWQHQNRQHAWPAWSTPKVQAWPGPGQIW